MVREALLVLLDNEDEAALDEEEAAELELEAAAPLLEITKRPD